MERHQEKDMGTYLYKIPLLGPPYIISINNSLLKNTIQNLN